MLSNDQPAANAAFRAKKMKFGFKIEAKSKEQRAD